MEEYKKWGSKMYGLMSDYPDLVPVPSWLVPDRPQTDPKTGSFIIDPSSRGQSPRLGYHGSLATLCSWVEQETDSHEN